VEAAPDKMQVFIPFERTSSPGSNPESAHSSAQPLRNGFGRYEETDNATATPPNATGVGFCPNGGLPTPSRGIGRVGGPQGATRSTMI
jgi:hypothetical protein